jgi:hypothetical protein
MNSHSFGILRDDVGTCSSFGAVSQAKRGEQSSRDRVATSSECFARELLRFELPSSRLKHLIATV